MARMSAGAGAAAGAARATDRNQHDVGPGHELLGPFRVQRVDDQHLGTDVRQHDGGLVVGVRRVQRHEGHAEPAQGEVEPDALEGRLGPPGHTLATGAPRARAGVGELIGQNVDLAERQPLVAQCHSQARRRRPCGTGQDVVGDERHCYSPLEDGVESRRPVSRRESMPRGADGGTADRRWDIVRARRRQTARARRGHMDRLADKVVIITGAGDGLGEVMAHLFAGEGAPPDVGRSPHRAPRAGGYCGPGQGGKGDRPHHRRHG